MSATRSPSPTVDPTPLKRSKPLPPPQLEYPDPISVGDEVALKKRRYFVRVRGIQNQVRTLDELEIVYFDSRSTSLMGGMQQALGGCFNLLCSTSDGYDIYVQDDALVRPETPKLNVGMHDALSYERLGKASFIPRFIFGPAIILKSDKGMTLKQAQKVWGILKKYTYRYATE